VGTPNPFGAFVTAIKNRMKKFEGGRRGRGTAKMNGEDTLFGRREGKWMMMKGPFIKGLL
jgi:hypothetical protein